MRPAFYRVARIVYLGGRSFGAGPLRLRWGGRYYTVGPITFGRIIHLGGVVSAIGGKVALDAGFLALPPDFQRVLAPMLAEGEIRARDLDRATPAQLAALVDAFLECNDWPTVKRAIEPSTAAPDPHALDTIVDVIGQRFGIWPHEVLGKPYAEVRAVLDVMGREAGEHEISDETAARVKQLAAQREAGRA